MGNLFNKIVNSLGKEIHTFSNNTKDINTNEDIEIKVVKYERGQICFYYKNNIEIPQVEITIIATPISYTRALQIRYIYYTNLKKIANLSILDPEGALPILLSS